MSATHTHTRTHQPPRGVNGAPYQAAEDGASRANVDLLCANNNKRLADLNTGTGACASVRKGGGGGGGGCGKRSKLKAEIPLV